MIRSMTGFGRGESHSGEYSFRVEIRSVNHRFLDVKLRLQREYAHLEPALTARCAERCQRGHLDVRISLQRAGEGNGSGPRVNRSVLDRLLEIAEGLEGLRGVRGGLAADAILGLPGVLDWDPAPIDLDDERFLAGAGQALDGALGELLASRDSEGRALEADLRDRLAAIEGFRRILTDRAPQREARERERLREKVAIVLKERPQDLDRRIEEEIVLLADRVDVSEELTRMGAHLDHLAAELDSGYDSVGRKLTFLLQELGREANTVGAKANDAEMQQAAIEIKAELEKMREQAENVE